MPQLQSLVRGKIGRMTFRSPAIALWIMAVLSFHECHGFIPVKTRQQRILVKAHKQHLASSTNRYGPQSCVVLLSQQSNDDQDDVDDPEVETKTSETITKSPNNQILPSSITSTSTTADDPIRTTIGGGVDTIFEMARQMLLWDETEDSFPASSTVPGRRLGTNLPFHPKQHLSGHFKNRIDSTTNRCSNRIIIIGRLRCC